MLVDEVERDGRDFCVGEREEFNGGLDGVGIGRGGRVGDCGEGGVGEFVEGEVGEAAEGCEDEGAVGGASEGDEERKESDGGGGWVFGGRWELLGEGAAGEDQGDVLSDDFEDLEEVHSELGRLLPIHPFPCSLLQHVRHDRRELLVAGKRLEVDLVRREVPQHRRRLRRPPPDHLPCLIHPESMQPSLPLVPLPCARVQEGLHESKQSFDEARELGHAKEFDVGEGDEDEAVQGPVDFGGDLGAKGEDDAVGETPSFEVSSCTRERGFSSALRLPQRESTHGHQRYVPTCPSPGSVDWQRLRWNCRRLDLVVACRQRGLQAGRVESSTARSAGLLAC